MSSNALQRWVSQGHVWLYRKMGGRLVPMRHRLVVVTTTGARSHEARTIPMVAFEHGDGWIVAAAYGGDHSPSWYHNMIANPEVVVEREGSTYRMVAREALGPERDSLWQKILEEEPSFASFQQKTERVIPVMVLERRPRSIQRAPVPSDISHSRSEEGSKT